MLKKKSFILILITLYMCFPKNTLAHFDLSTGVGARSYPGIGAEAIVESGYNYVFWGKGDKKKPLYGLVRPTISAATSAVVNNYDARLEFYPISFLGLIRGYRHINSSFDKFNFYDCDEVRCKGDIKRDYSRIKLALGAFGFLTITELTQSNNSYSGDSLLPVAEFRFATLANPSNDEMYQARYILAMKHDNNGIMGVVSEYTKFARSGQTNNMDLLIYTTKKDRTNYTYGIGQFMSTHWARGFIAVFRMKTSFIESNSLF